MGFGCSSFPLSSFSFVDFSDLSAVAGGGVSVLGLRPLSGRVAGISLNASIRGSLASTARFRIGTAPRSSIVRRVLRPRHMRGKSQMKEERERREDVVSPRRVSYHRHRKSHQNKSAWAGRTGKTGKRTNLKLPSQQPPLLHQFRAQHHEITRAQHRQRDERTPARLAIGGAFVGAGERPEETGCEYGFEDCVGYDEGAGGGGFVVFGEDEVG